MATVRRRRHAERTGRVTAAAHAAWKARDREALHSALRLPPWQPSPLELDGECPWPAGTAAARTWQDSIDLREALRGHG